MITPAIDKLSADGVRLENYYVNFLCSPTRTSLMSGRYVRTRARVLLRVATGVPRSGVSRSACGIVQPAPDAVALCGTTLGPILLLLPPPTYSLFPSRFGACFTPTVLAVAC